MNQRWTLHYNRKGEAITREEWVQMDPAQARVAQTTLPDGTWISTVHLGLDHSFGSGPPVIFETMVFPSQDTMEPLDCERYCTEAEAVDGHARMIEKWRTKGGDR